MPKIGLEPAPPNWCSKQSNVHKYVVGGVRGTSPIFLSAWSDLYISLCTLNSGAAFKRYLKGSEPRPCLALL